MSDDRDTQIARAVALKAAVDYLAGKTSGQLTVEEQAERFERWLLRGTSTSEDIPFDYEEQAAAPECKCGTRMEYFSGANANGDEYAGYRCPNQKKTRDPAEQKAEKERHPVQWL